jgi:uncharacterized protein YdaU (DUF1376 family)
MGTRRLRLPWYRWYPGDWLNDEAVSLMTIAQEGAYRRLLDHQWWEGSIPSDLRALAQLTKTTPEAFAADFWPAISPHFKPCQCDRIGRLSNRRLEEVRKEAEEELEKKSRAGSAGADARWKARKIEPKPKPDAQVEEEEPEEAEDASAIPVALREQCPSESESSSSPPTPRELPEGVGGESMETNGGKTEPAPAPRAQHPPRRPPPEKPPRASPVRAPATMGPVVERAWEVFSEEIQKRRTGHQKIQDIAAYVRHLRERYRTPQEAGHPWVDEILSKREEEQMRTEIRETIRGTRVGAIFVGTKGKPWRVTTEGLEEASPSGARKDPVLWSIMNTATLKRILETTEPARQPALAGSG